MIPLGVLGAATPRTSGPPVSIYLDDLATSPGLAFGIKKLISTATVAIRVRRDSDNTTLDVGFSGDDLDVAALMAFVGSGSGYVARIFDQAGTGAHFNPPAGSSIYQPRIVNAGMFDDRAVWDAINDCLQTINIVFGTSRVWVFAQWEQATDANVRVLLELADNYSNNDNRFAIYTYATQGQMLCAMGTAGKRVHSFPNAAGMGVWTYLFDKAATGSDQIKAWRDGVALTPTLVANTDVTGTFETNVLNLGARNGAASLFSALKARSVVIYKDDVSAIRGDIEAVLAA